MSPYMIDLLEADSVSAKDTVGAIFDPALASLLIGTRVRKQFGQEFHNGVVVSYDAAPSQHGAILHLVSYEDSEHEHLPFSDVLKLHLEHCRYLARSSPTPSAVPLLLPQAAPTIPTSDCYQAYISSLGPTPSPEYPIDMGLPARTAGVSVPVPLPTRGLTPCTPINRTRTSKDHIIWLLRPNTPPHDPVQVNNDDFLLSLSHHKGSLNKPSKDCSPPTLTPLLHFDPFAAPDSRWTHSHPFVGLGVQVRSPPPHFTSPPSRKEKSPHHNCVVEAVLVPTSLSTSPHLWLRSMFDPSVGFVATDPSFLSNSTFNYHFSYTAGKSFTNIPAPRVPDPLVPSASHHLRDSLLKFALSLPDEPLQLFSTGFLCSDKPIPKSLKSSFRRAYLEVLLLLPEHEALAIKLLLTLDGLLRAPPTVVSDAHSNPPSFASSLRSRLDLFFAGDLFTLASSTIRLRTPTGPIAPSTSDVAERAASSAERILNRTGSVSSSAKKLREEALPPSPTDLYDKFRSLCPQPGDPIPIPLVSDPHLSPLTQRTYPPLQDPLVSLPRNHPSISFSTTEYMAAITSRNVASSAGLSGMSFSTLRLLLEHDDALTEALSDLLNNVLAGRTHPLTRRLLTAGRAIFLPKDNGGLRPIVVGEVLIRFVSSMAVKSVSTPLLEHLLPHQVGCGLPSGAELGADVIRATLDQHPDWVVVTLDAANAFNTFDRNHTWPEVARVLPSLLPLYAFLYGVPSDQCFADSDAIPRSVPSSVGSRQGCALGTLAHAINLQPVLLRVNESVLTPRDPLLISYVDDSTIVAPLDLASRAYHSYSHHLTSITCGSLRPSKCEVYGPHHSTSTLQHHFPSACIKPDGLSFLGSPIGSPEFILAHFERAFAPLLRALDRLPHCRHLHNQFVLLQKSLQHLPVFHLRAFPHSLLPVLAARLRGLDHRIRTTIHRICCPLHPLTTESWSIARLPQSSGGLGLNSLEELADAAFLAKYTYSALTIPRLFPHLAPSLPPANRLPPAPPTHSPGTRPSLVHLAVHCFSRLSDLLPNTDVAKLLTLPADTPIHHIQRRLISPAHEQLKTAVIAGLSVRDRAQLLSSAGDPHTFSATPSSASLLLTNSQFGIASSRRLLLPVHHPSPSLTCPRCSEPMDPLGDHTLRCKKGLPARTKHWHDKIVRALARNLRSLGLRVSVEVDGLPSNRLPSNKRADLIIYSPNPASRPDTICDVRTCLPSLPNLQTASSFTPGHAASCGQRDKIRAWHLTATLCHCAFAPLAFEDGGRVGPYVSNLINGSISHASSNKSECAARQTLIWRDLSITNTRGVADTILKAPPLEPDPQTLTLLHRNSVLTDLPPPLFPHTRAPPLPSPPGPTVPRPAWLRQDVRVVDVLASAPLPVPTPPPSDSPPTTAHPAPSPTTSTTCEEPRFPP